MLALCLFTDGTRVDIAQRLRYMGMDVSAAVREQNASEEYVVENALEESVVGSDDDADGGVDANNGTTMYERSSSGDVNNDADGGVDTNNRTAMYERGSSGDVNSDVGDARATV